MKIKLKHNLSTPQPTSAPSSFGRNEIKKFRTVSKQKTNTDAAELSTTRLAVATQLQALREYLQSADYFIENMDSIWNAAINGTLKDKMAYREYMLTVFRHVRNDSRDTREEIENSYALLVRYLVLLRAFTGDEAAHAKTLANQLYMVNMVLQVMIRDTYAATYLSVSIHKERESIAILFRTACNTCSDQSKLMPIIDSWLGFGLSRATQNSMLLSNKKFKEWLLRNGDTTPDMAPSEAVNTEHPLFPMVSGNPAYDFDEQPPATMAAAIREVVQSDTLDDASVLFPPPLSGSKIKAVNISPREFTPEVDEGISDYYRGLEHVDSFHESDSERAEEWVYEGWTTDFYETHQAQQRLLNDQLKDGRMTLKEW